MSRPQAGNNPSAIDQKSAIYNKTIFGGLVHDTHFSPQWSHTLSLFGSHTNFENPFITNYEFRTENNLGIRTYLSYTNENQPNLGWEMQLGFEGQTGSYSIKNYDNNEGTVGDPQAFDDLNNTQNSLFYRARTLVYRALTIEGTMGVHQFRVGFQQQYPQLHQKLEAVILLTIHIAIVAAAIIALYYYHLLHYAVYLYLAFIIYKFNYSFSKKIHNYV